MATQIVINGVVIQTYEKIKYVFQVNDIAEVSDRQATYTTNWKIARTNQVEKLFAGLGIAGDTSRSPYEKISCILMENYVPIIYDGWLEIISTDPQYYNVTVYSGVIDFFKAIEGYTLQDLDLSEIEHIKDVDGVVETWDENWTAPYRYFVSDYGGFNTYSRAGLTNIVNVDYQVPAVHVEYLWNKIFERFGFTYTGNVFSLGEFQKLWITFPKQPVLSDTEVVLSRSMLKNTPWNAGPIRSDESITGYAAWNVITPGQAASSTSMTGGNWSVRINESGNYRIEIINATGSAEYGVFGNLGEAPWTLQTQRNGVVNIIGLPPINSTESDSNGMATADISLNANDVINFAVERALQFNNQTVWDITVEKIEVAIYKIEDSAVPQSDFVDLSITDFFKEILWRYSLTPFVDTETNNVHFLTFEERTQYEDIKVVDWTDKYVQRTKEEYDLGYAQNNWMRYQYDDETSTYNDGAIIVDNANADNDRDLIVSKTYSPSQFSRPLPINSTQNISVFTFKKFDGEARIEDGSLVLDYDSLDRYFFIKGERDERNINIGSYNIQGDEITQQGFYRASFDGLSWQSVIQDNYKAFGDIINDPRVHTIDVALTPVDANALNLQALYYFKQEGNFYILNRLEYQEGQVSTGEFIRVKRDISLGSYNEDYSNDYDN